MTVIGLTGGSGGGKTTLCKAAADLGFYVIDADKVGHGVLRKDGGAYHDVVAAFGAGILSRDGEIDRKKLGGIVFADGEKLKLLNRVTHEKITETIEIMIKMCDNSVVVIDAAALFESGMDQKCDYVVAVLASKERRAARIQAREGLSREAALARIESQREDEYYAARAHKTLYNNGSISRLYREGKKLFEEAAHGKT